MEYIKTQKELYKVMQKQICNTDKFVEVQRKKVGLFTGTTELISKDDIIGQADTIEELLDELVVHNPSNDGDFYPKHFVYQNKWENMLKPMSDYQKSKGIEVYGAIWTDKGLIYVAKMNSNGELELL